jgi:hypothetical protein
VMSTSPDDWSPADNPYAIAVSEAQWWRSAVHLGVLRLRDEDDPRIGWFSSRQIEARQLLFALRQLMSAERLEQVALEARGVDPAVGEALAEARLRFQDALPGIRHMRDALTHFDEWSRGKGWGPQKDRVRAGETLRDVAREYWGFAYDPAAGTVSLGPYSIGIEAAGRAAVELSQAIYLAAREVDKKNASDVRTEALRLLAAAGIEVDTPNARLRISDGRDSRIWLSMNNEPGTDEHECGVLAEEVVAVLVDGGLRLMCPTEPQSQDFVPRLARGETLWVERDKPAGVA